LTGKSLLFGGSPFRPEATGYGLIYITKLAVENANKSMVGMRCIVSGSGNVAQFASQKLLELGSKVLSLSDSNGVLIFDDGMTPADLKAIMEVKNVQRGRLSALEGKVSGRYVHGQTVWEQDLSCDIALPCATQNEIDETGAKRLVKNGAFLVGEGANLPTTLQGQDVFRSSPGLVYLPAKAANAGGVGVSGLEMSQNAQKITWEPEEVDSRLRRMMADIYKQCRTGGGTLEQGANRAGFRKVAMAMKELGWVQ
jgi:glutamate dehydrogenase (NADP+)